MMLEKYWIVRPNCYHMINEIVNCNFSEGQIQQMRDCDPIEGVIIYSREYCNDRIIKRGTVYYRDFGLYEPNIDAVFQFEINLKTIRKMKLQKINKDYGIR